MTEILTLTDVRNSLIEDLENYYSQSDIEFIDKRLAEIANENNLSMEDLDYYCTLDSNKMFGCIFDYIDLKEYFEI